MRFRIILTLIPLLLMSAITMPLVLTTGCSVINPGADAVVVNAERVAQASFEIMDAFVLYEFNNRDALRKLNPEIEKAANNVRTDGRKAIEQLRMATAAYKSKRTAENKATIETWIILVETIKQIALEHLTASQRK